MGNQNQAARAKRGTRKKGHRKRGAGKKGGSTIKKEGERRSKTGHACCNGPSKTLEVLTRKRDKKKST